MRVLLVGGGCRGRALTRSLVADGHAVRAVTRSEAGRAAIEDAGAECWIGDPDVIGTLRYALDNVTILIWALGSAAGDADAVAALHGPRLRMMLEKSVDTMVRGFAYEPPADAALRAQGLAVLQEAARTWEIPTAVVDGDPRSGVAQLLR